MTLVIGADNVNIATDKIISVDFPVITVTGALTAGVHRRIGLNTSLNSVTALLPAAASVPNVSFLIMRVVSNANVATIQADGAELIDGKNSIELVLIGDYQEIVSDGVGWNIINYADQTIVNPLMMPQNVLLADDTLLIGLYNICGGGTNFTIESLVPIYNADVEQEILIQNFSGASITINLPANEYIVTTSNSFATSVILLEAECLVLYPLFNDTWGIKSAYIETSLVGKTGQFNDLIITGTFGVRNGLFDTGGGVFVERPMQFDDMLGLQPALDDKLNLSGGTVTGEIDIDTTTGALILPRLTNGQRNALSAVEGMIIYNTSNNKFQGYDGSWTDLS